MNKWEIWLASVYFEDNIALSKIRPVLIYDNRQTFIISFKMTSHSPRNINDYPVKFYKEAGLKKQTTVRLDKKLKLNDSDFICHIGNLHPYDINQINHLLKSMNNK